MHATAEFDAYCATVRKSTGAEVCDALWQRLRLVPEVGKPRRRYGSVIDLMDGGRVAAWVGEEAWCGQVYVEAKGETTPGVAEVIRAGFAHSVPRVDVRLDFDTGEPELFPYLREVLSRVKPVRAFSGFQSLSDDPQDGRTWAIGKRGGVVYQRLYEAGKQPEKAHWGRPHAVRYEQEIRPHYAADKASAALLTPHELLGFTNAGQVCAAALLELDVPRFLAPSRVYSVDRTTAYVARAYRRHFAQKLADLGSWECIGREVEDTWAEDDALALAVQRRAS